LVIANTRELVNQIYEVFAKLLKGTGITVSNFNTEYKPSQIIISTHGKIQLLIQGRKPINLSFLKSLVIDEADFFF
jgi:superfamily II DNA/RNA helicase